MQTHNIVRYDNNSVSYSKTFLGNQLVNLELRVESWAAVAAIKDRDDIFGKIVGYDETVERHSTRLDGFWENQDDKAIIMTGTVQGEFHTLTLRNKGLTPVRYYVDIRDDEDVDDFAFDEEVLMPDHTVRCNEFLQFICDDTQLTWRILFRPHDPAVEFEQEPMEIRIELNRPENDDEPMVDPH